MYDTLLEWVGCSECDPLFPCYDGKAVCIRLNAPSTPDCRTCENHRINTKDENHLYCYNEEHWRKRCVNANQYKALEPIKMWVVK